MDLPAIKWGASAACEHMVWGRKGLQDIRDRDLPLYRFRISGGWGLGLYSFRFQGSWILELESFGFQGLGSWVQEGL